MFAKINHLAIVSENNASSAKFYEAVFGMKTSSRARPESGGGVRDGYLGMQLIPRFPGRAARLDHFGFEVADIEQAYARLRRDYPEVKWLKRPSNRPFAGVSAHDPDGNYFDISQQNMENRGDVYVEQGKLNPRHVSHFALRTMHPGAMADFYRNVFELEARNKKEGDPNHYLTDGHVTLVIMPWCITDYEATGIATPALDHIGFTVESIEQFKADVARVASTNPKLAPYPIEYGPEGKARLALARRSCPLCQHHLADPDGIMLSVSEA
jgi:predicted enzyme related to lactoylglutathione lyase